MRIENQQNVAFLLPFLAYLAQSDDPVTTW